MLRGKFLMLERPRDAALMLPGEATAAHMGCRGLRPKGPRDEDRAPKMPFLIFLAPFCTCSAPSLSLQQGLGAVARGSERAPSRRLSKPPSGLVKLSCSWLPLAQLARQAPAGRHGELQQREQCSY